MTDTNPAWLPDSTNAKRFTADEAEAPFEQTQPLVFEIRVRANSQAAWTTFAEKPADLARARYLGAWQASVFPAGEILVVGECGPVDRWLDGQRAALESLTPGHPGGCTCGECIVRWQHREGDPRHESCGHGVCVVCNACEDCDWDDLQRQMQQLAATNLTSAGDAVGTALIQVHEAHGAFLTLRREVSATELDIDGLPGGDITAAIAKLDRVTEELEDVARIVEAAQLRAQLAERRADR